ncbi:hypothetical protein B0H17DRAFT_1162147 [Mycena rosella]|uniref:Protein kinase domain-containing protein n=1 Tax=Mycena rosella TaxID=1033263 RepID=A0AAD7GA93_MYCRO|nr:hypothetical protein B0H17DRAFT_1162147 [Mycena rosella]
MAPELIQLELQVQGTRGYRKFFWRDYQPWLLERGYRLRKCYQPGWVASRKTRGRKYTAEDSARPLYGKIMDAVRISDGILDALKRSDPVEYPHEVEIAQLFSSEALTAGPRNHCWPDLNDAIILVMPLLYPLKCPVLETLGEVVESFWQIFEGVQFIYENNIAYRDCKYDSFLVIHKRYMAELTGSPTRYLMRNEGLSGTFTAVKYYIIDFNLSFRYEDSGPHLEKSRLGRYKTVPSNSIRENFTEVGPDQKRFSFMESLVNVMYQDDPKARPIMVEVVARFERIRLGLSERKLRSRIARMEHNFVPGAFRFIFHWGRQVVPICRRTPAIPTR